MPTLGASALDRMKQTFIVLGVVGVAVFGIFAINSITLKLMEGKTLNPGYLLTLVDCALYLIWFSVLASVSVSLLRPRPILPLGIAALGVFLSLHFIADVWVNPQLPFSEKAVAYFYAYVADFLVFPAFLFVGFVVQRGTPSLPFKRDALERAP